MKTNYWLALALACSTNLLAQDAPKPTQTPSASLHRSTNLFAQDAPNPPAPAAEAPPAKPAEPLSQATMDKIAKMTSIFDGKTLDGWKASTKGVNEADVASAWSVKDGVIASAGAGRGVLYTTKEFGNYRIVFNMRHVSGQPDHQACVLVYCHLPTAEEKALDAIGGIQFQVPNGGHWDYRPTENGVKHNNGGGSLFTKVTPVKYNVHEWSQVEILVNTNGTARMAVAQPVGTKAVEVLDFQDPTAGRKGPFALQMHNKGLFDEYKDLRVEENPAEDKLITTE
jgi:hypothetical protein